MKSTILVLFCALVLTQGLSVARSSPAPAYINVQAAMIKKGDKIRWSLPYTPSVHRRFTVLNVKHEAGRTTLTTFHHMTGTLTSSYPSSQCLNGVAQAQP